MPSASSLALVAQDSTPNRNRKILGGTSCNLDTGEMVVENFNPSPYPCDRLCTQMHEETHVKQMESCCKKAAAAKKKEMREEDKNHVEITFYFWQINNEDAFDCEAYGVSQSCYMIFIALPPNATCACPNAAKGYLNESLQKAKYCSTAKPIEKCPFD